MSKYNDLAYFEHNIYKPIAIRIYERCDGFSLNFQLREDGYFYEVETVRGGGKLYKSIKAVYNDITRVFPCGFEDLPVSVSLAPDRFGYQPIK